MIRTTEGPVAGSGTAWFAVDRNAVVPRLAVVIMAAGLGKRMQSKHAKVLHPVAGQAMVLYSVALGLRVAGHRLAVVVGHQGERVRRLIEAATAGSNGRAPVSVVEQREQLGTGHAVLQTRSVFAADPNSVPARYLILNGDTPLLQESTVRKLLHVHLEEKAAVTLLTATPEDASGYGRVVRHATGGGVERIVEDRDARPEEKSIREINVGTYVVDGEFLFAALERLDPGNDQGEYYLTDIVQSAGIQGRRVSAVMLDDPDEGLGVNTRRQLADAERVIRRRIRDRWLEAGVTMIDPRSTWIDTGAAIGKDTTLYPNVMIEGSTVLGEDCVVHSGCRITNCVVGRGVEILDHSILRDSQVEDGAVLGPFVHLRPGVLIRRKGKVGNFVEMKKTELGEGSKANHLSYLGDARIGKDVNIGAGTITCNYDGVQKHETVIGDRVFVGSDTQFIAPVTVGAGAIVAAGTTVTQDVPSDALAIARVPQVIRAGWAARRRALSRERSGTGEEQAPLTRDPARRTKTQRPKARPKKRGRVRSGKKRKG